MKLRVLLLLCILHPSSLLLSEEGMIKAPAAATFWNLPKAGDLKKIKLPGNVALDLCYCPAGEFTMGFPAEEKYRTETEKQVKVKISQGYWLAKTELTQGQWRAIMGNSPSWFKGDMLPVEWVTWKACVACMAKLNEECASQLPAGYRFSLPTEAQWEYACRAGTTTTYHYGDKLDKTLANFDGVVSGATVEVGSYKPNAFGLYDMHGNVSEWCLASWDVKSELPGGIDPVGTTGAFRVCRGGAWPSWDMSCRSAKRMFESPGRRQYDLGLQVAAVPSR